MCHVSLQAATQTRPVDQYSSRRNLFPPVKVAVKQTASSSCCWRDEEHQEVLTTDSTSESHTDIFSVGLNVLDSVRFSTATRI